MKKRNELMTKDRENLKVMLDAMPYVCLLWDRNPKMLDCNQAGLKLFKLKTKEEFMARFDEFSPEHQPDGQLSAEKIYIKLKFAFSEGRCDFDWMHVSTDGTLIPCRVSAIKINLKGEDYVVTYINDQTEHNKMVMDIKLSAEKLRGALEEANAANIAKSNFLSNMSHEIRTPMNAIIGMTELLVHEQLNARQTSYVSDISVSAKSLLGIINDILDFSKIESGKLELNPVDYDFRIFVDNINSMFIYVAQKKELEFKLVCDENLPGYLYGDDIRLRQTLTNILGNAVKFTEKGSVQLKVTAADGFLSFEIKDTGIGIRKEDMPTLFHAFEQVDKSKNRNVVGTGLGLAISKSFVEMMGGKITLESEYEQGTTFTVVIPIVEGSKERVEIKEAAHCAHVIYAPEANILVVDDNEFNLKVAQGLLGLLRIHADTADSGKKGIEAVRNGDYDIVFMDHMMPEMDGVETTAHIRELSEKHKTMPIVALTANAISGAKEMFLANGFNDFISKPIDSAELVTILERWLPPAKILKEAAGDKQEPIIITETKTGFLGGLEKIDALNVDIGLSRVSGLEDMYRETLKFFNMKLPSECAKMCEALTAGDIRGFAILVHAMKSALSTIGAMPLSETSFNLEVAAKNNELDFCTENYTEYEANLLKLHEALSEVISQCAEPEPAPVQPAVCVPEGERKLILAVDDAAFSLQMLKNHLSSSPYKLACVTSGADALRFITKKTPDLFLLDMEMPVMDGCELAEKIISEGQKAPIVFLTGNASEEYVARARDAGASDFLVKPVNKEQLMSVIEKFV
jgi:signal transduction histidine kinase/DNA-binding response OmpR family regulator